MAKKMTRRTFLMGVGGAAALASFGTVATARRKPRNVIWIVDDDQPQYMMDPMPFTKRNIRNKGIEFPRGHTDIPLCGPARVSLLTGLSVITHGIDTNNTYDYFSASGLSLRDRIISRHLNEAGYTTGHFGKYINGYKDSYVPPYWDRWAQTRGGGPERKVKGATINLDGEEAEISAGHLASLWTARRCAEFIKTTPGPFFAHYCPTIPHQPYTPTNRHKHSYDNARRRSPSVNEKNMSDKPRWMRDLDPLGKQVLEKEFEGKKEELRDLDYFCIRPILQALEESGQLHNTVIFFTSDNGHMHGEHRLKKKDRPYWESSEVPFFVKGAGVRRGKRQALVNHTDLAPTTASIAGVPARELEMDGWNMDWKLRRRGFRGWRKRMLVTGSEASGPQINPGGANNPTGRWWLLREGNAAFILRENGGKELYWMKSDPHQLHNKRLKAPQHKIDRYTRLVHKMRSASGEWRRRLEG